MTTATAIESAEMRIAMTRKQARRQRVLGILPAAGAVAVWLVSKLPVLARPVRQQSCSTVSATGPCTP